MEKIFSYFPGCSLATTAKENNASLINLCEKLGIKLVELEDWNCCGSSSAHSMDRTLADKLAMRNLYLAPTDRPLLTACPSCHLRLRHAHHQLNTDETARDNYRRWFGRPAEPGLQIMHFFELLDQIDWPMVTQNANERLHGLKFAPYYGCMLARPPVMRYEKNYHGIMERILSNLGATPVSWAYASRCCGTFLSVVRPDVVTSMVRSIIANAAESGAECLVTACAMCHLNLEVRSTNGNNLPIFHFSEVLSLALSQVKPEIYFDRHLIDPGPLLKERNLWNGR
jgi:heterodisulfide reductase subunit B2